MPQTSLCERALAFGLRQSSSRSLIFAACLKVNDVKKCILHQFGFTANYVLLLFGTSLEEYATWISMVISASQFLRMSRSLSFSVCDFEPSLQFSTAPYFASAF